MLYVASIDENRAAQAYMYAIKGVSVAALARVAGKLMRGEYERDNAAFIPSPPEFAILAREEQRRINEAAKPRIDPTPRSQPFKDLRVTQRQRSEELAREGFVLFATDVNHEKFASMAKARKLPVGSRHLWAIDEVWAPRQAQMPAVAPSVTSQEEDAA